MFSLRFSRISARFLELKFVFLINQFGGVLASGRENVQGNPKRSETLKANVSPPARTESLYLNMALHEPVLCFLFFFLQREGKKKAGFNSKLKRETNYMVQMKGRYLERPVSGCQVTGQGAVATFAEIAIDPGNLRHFPLM